MTLVLFQISLADARNFRMPIQDIYLSLRQRKQSTSVKDTDNLWLVVCALYPMFSATWHRCLSSNFSQYAITCALRVDLLMLNV